MVHVHGRDVAARVAGAGRTPATERLLVPVDVGKHEAMALVADATGERHVAPFTFALDRPGLGELVARVERIAADRDAAQVEVGVESAGHYHRPVTASGLLPEDWTLVELNPGHVTEQRKVLGKRGVKTDQIDLAAMFDLLVAGRGRVVPAGPDPLLQLQSWAGLRHRRVGTVIATKNQLLGQMDRAFPGAGRCVSGSLLATKVGRLVIAEFSDPNRLARLGVERFRRFAANRDVLVQRKVAERFVAAARTALPLRGAEAVPQPARGVEIGGGELTPLATPLVAVLLEREEVADAWLAATTYGCDGRTWHQLARRSATHQLDVVAIHHRQALHHAEQTKRPAYRAAVRALTMPSAAARRATTRIGSLPSATTSASSTAASGASWRCSTSAAGRRSPVAAGDDQHLPQDLPAVVLHSPHGPIRDPRPRAREDLAGNTARGDKLGASAVASSDAGSDRERGARMRTTITLDDELVAEAERLTGLTGRSELLREGLRTLVRVESAKRLAALGGTDPEAAAAPRRRAEAQ